MSCYLCIFRTVGPLHKKLRVKPFPLNFALLLLRKCHYCSLCDSFTKIRWVLTLSLAQMYLHIRSLNAWILLYHVLKYIVKQSVCISVSFTEICVMLFTDNSYNWSTSHEAASSISVIDDYPKLRPRPFLMVLNWYSYANTTSASSVVTTNIFAHTILKCRRNTLPANCMESS